MSAENVNVTLLKTRTYALSQEQTFVYNIIGTKKERWNPFDIKEIDPHTSLLSLLTPQGQNLKIQINRILDVELTE